MQSVLLSKASSSFLSHQSSVKPSLSDMRPLLSKPWVSSCQEWLPQSLHRG